MYIDYNSTLIFYTKINNKENNRRKDLLKLLILTNKSSY